MRERNFKGMGERLTNFKGEKEREREKFLRVWKKDKFHGRRREIGKFISLEFHLKY